MMCTADMTNTCGTDVTATWNLCGKMMLRRTWMAENIFYLIFMIFVKGKRI